VRGLLVFRRFAHDPQGVLAAVYRLACMNVELLLNATCGFGEVAKSMSVCGELCIASFTDAENWNIFCPLYDSEFAVGHSRSLAHPGGRA
jgi:hypothetical protein